MGPQLEFMTLPNQNSDNLLEEELEPTDDFDGVEDTGEYPIIPTIDTPGQVLENGERFVEYSDRGPRDVVLSGPLTGGWGPGRWFQNRSQAYSWAVNKYTLARVKGVRERAGRWAFLIKNLRVD